MTKTILLGMTAEEIVEKLKGATSQEILEFKQLIRSMDNYKEIEEEITKVFFAEAKKELVKAVNEAVDEEEKLFVDSIHRFVCALEDSLKEEKEDAEDMEEAQDLVSMLRDQMANPKTTLADQLKAQLEPKKSLTDLLREQMQPEKTLVELLKEQMEETKEAAASVTKEEVLSEIIKEIVETELEYEEMVINPTSFNYEIAIGLMFSLVCSKKNVLYDFQKKDIEVILSSVIDHLIQNGRKVEVRIEEGKTLTVIR